MATGTFTPEEFESIASLLDSAKPQHPTLINGYVKADRKYAPLLKSANARSVVISRDSREFRCSEPVFVSEIDIAGESAKKIKEGLSISVLGLDGKLTEVEGKVVNLQVADGTSVPTVRYRPDRVVVAVTAKSNLQLRTLKATRVRVYGYSLSQLDAIAENVRRSLDLSRGAAEFVAAEEQKVNNAQQAVNKLQLQIADGENRFSSLSEEKGALEAEIAGLERDLGVAREGKTVVDIELRDVRSKLEAAKNSHAQLTETVGALNREVAQKKGELDRLVNDRNLISDEFKDYVAEGRQQSKIYASFLACAIAIIGFAAWQLYSGASRILDADVDGINQLLAMALQRFPFAAALALLITIAWKLGAMFAGRIMTIHSQRLALARLLVLAKDTVYSSAAGLEVTDELKFRERIRLKLAMLKAHLTSELGNDFEFSTEARVDATKAAVDEELAKAAAAAD